jgi:hypothetical protein
MCEVRGAAAAGAGGAALPSPPSPTAATAGKRPRKLTAPGEQIFAFAVGLRRNGLSSAGGDRGIAAANAAAKPPLTPTPLPLQRSLPHTSDAGAATAAAVSSGGAVFGNYAWALHVAAGPPDAAATAAAGAAESSGAPEPRAAAPARSLRHAAGRLRAAISRFRAHPHGAEAAALAYELRAAPAPALVATALRLAAAQDGFITSWVRATAKLLRDAALLSGAVLLAAAQARTGGCRAAARHGDGAARLLQHLWVAPPQR